MILTIILFVIAIIGVIGCSLFLPNIKIKKFSIETFWIVPFICALIILSCSILTMNELQDGLLSQNGINPIQILIIFLSMSYISIALDTTGFFAMMSSFAARKAKGSQIRFFIALYLVISLLTVFTSNDIIILTFTPFIILYSRKVKINPIPYLIMEFVAANTWSTFLLIGNPTNIYITGSLNIGFFEYIQQMWLPTIAVGIISLFIVFLLFKKQLSTPMISLEEKEKETVNKPTMVSILIVLLLTIVTMSISSFITIPMYIVSLSGFIASFVIIVIDTCLKREKSGLFESFRRIPYSVIPFLLSMFVISLSLTKVGVPQKIAEYLNQFPETFSYGLSAFLSCNLFNNIPMSVLFSEILASGSAPAKAIYAVVLASNLGAIFTPIGALASIMWMSSLHEKGIKFRYIDFVKYGSIISIAALAIGLIVIHTI